MLTRHGYESLGWKGGRLNVGEAADFIVVDLAHHSLFGVEQQDLLDTLILSGATDAIKAVYVNGKPILTDGHSPEESRIRAAYLSAVKALSP